MTIWNRLKKWLGFGPKPPKPLTPGIYHCEMHLRRMDETDWERQSERISVEGNDTFANDVFNDFMSRADLGKGTEVFADDPVLHKIES